LSIKNKARLAVNRALAPFGLQVSRSASPDRDSRPVSAAMTVEIAKRCTPAMQKVAAFFGGASDSDIVMQQIEQFFDLYGRFSLRQGYGSSGVAALLTLYVSGRAADPALVLESGVFQGFGSWALRAACPRAQMHCYDLTFQHLLYRDETIYYHEKDWTSGDPAFAPSRDSLAYFDDHVNQAQRISEAHERGIRWLIFDDNVSWFTLHRDGLPPIPTVDMVCDESLHDNAELEWMSAARPMRYRRNKAFDLEIRSKIARYERVDNLHNETGYPSTPMALVELTPR
jgi:hypothetical protein